MSQYSQHVFDQFSRMLPLEVLHLCEKPLDYICGVQHGVGVCPESIYCRKHLLSERMGVKRSKHLDELMKDELNTPGIFANYHRLSVAFHACRAGCLDSERVCSSCSGVEIQGIACKNGCTHEKDASTENCGGGDEEVKRYDDGMLGDGGNCGNSESYTTEKPQGGNGSEKAAHIVHHGNTSTDSSSSSQNVTSLHRFPLCVPAQHLPPFSPVQCFDSGKNTPTSPSTTSGRKFKLIKSLFLHKLSRGAGVAIDDHVSYLHYMLDCYQNVELDVRAREMQVQYGQVHYGPVPCCQSHIHAFSLSRHTQALYHQSHYSE